MNQRERALQTAEKRRLGIAAVKREIRQGDISLAQALADSRSDPEQVRKIMKTKTGWGETIINRVLHNVGVQHDARVRELSPRKFNLLYREVDFIEQLPSPRSSWKGSPTYQVRSRIAHHKEQAKGPHKRVPGGQVLGSQPAA
jgi:hypothetical protein